MATQHSSIITEGNVPSGAGLKIGIVVSEWNASITGSLLDGCRATLLKHEVAEDHIVVQQVPGSYELPMGARLLSSGQNFDAIICLGCVIKGETKHDQYISQSVASGLMQLSLMTNVPVIFGVLTPNTQAQAEARAGGELGNKGEESAITAIKMAILKQRLGKSPHKIGFS
jgi:6,7-dimethyl-8-ribityllumazine synthase